MSARTSFAAIAAAVCALAVVPWDDSPLRRLAGGDGDGPEPRLDVPLDASALREAHIPHGATYFVSAQGSPPLVQGNVKAASQLYLASGLPVVAPADAAYAVRIDGRRITLEPRR